MKFDFEKFKFYFLTLLATLFGTSRDKPIEIDIYIEDNIDPVFVQSSLYLIPQLWKFNLIEESFEKIEKTVRENKIDTVLIGPVS